MLDPAVEHYLISLEDSPMVRMPAKSDIRRSVKALEAAPTKTRKPVFVLPARVYASGKLVDSDVDVVVDPGCSFSYLHWIHVPDTLAAAPYQSQVVLSPDGHVDIHIHAGTVSKDQRYLVPVADISPYDCVLGQDWLCQL